MSLISDFIQCPICLENYDESVRVPRMLTACQHAFCSVCLKGMYKKTNSVECPMCRVHTLLAYADVPKNRFILQYLESLGGAAKIERRQSLQCDLSVGSSETSNNRSHPIPQCSNRNSNVSSVWDDKKFYREMFEDIDHNKDGRINYAELCESLRKGQPNSQFDKSTVQLLLLKYDRNNDQEINQEEFHALFTELNAHFNDFLDIDVDCSGGIDARELAAALLKKGYHFSDAFHSFMVDELCKRTATPHHGITFDLYVRVIARIDYLRYQYVHVKNLPSKYGSLEAFISGHFFNHF